MNFIINTKSMIPIYEQIMDIFKSEIINGNLKDGDALPSVRGLANDLKISALTVKKAYDQLEEEGFIATVHGKGSFVKSVGSELVREEQLKILESDMELICEKARLFGVSNEFLREILDIVMGE
mgnify:CR=1 FL=1